MISQINNIYSGHKRIIQYVFFSVMTAVLHVIVFYLANLVIESLVLCNVISYAFSILFSFVINKKVVFKNNSENYGTQLLKYLLVKLSSFGIDTLVLLILTRWLLMPTLVAKVIANCSTTFNNYFLSKKFVF